MATQLLLKATLVTECRTVTTASEAQASMGLSQISERLKSHILPSETSTPLLPTSGGNAGSLDHHGSVWAHAGLDHMNEGNITHLGGWNTNLWSFGIGYDYKFKNTVGWLRVSKKF